MSPETVSKIQLWRQKAREGKLEQDEMREIINTLRQDRIASNAVSAKSKATKATAKAKKDINSDDLLSDLEGL